MSLDVENFNLFGKKSNKTPARPIAVPVTSAKVVEEEINKFDAEIERFEEIQLAPVMDIESFEKPMNTVIKAAELTLRAPEKNKDDAPLRKFETFVAPTFRIPEAHDLELKKIEHFIMRNRKKGNNADSRERITTNTVVRAMIANFLERAGDMDLSNIDNEEMLKERMEKVFKQKYSKRS